MAYRYITKNGPISVVGIPDAGAGWDRKPDLAGDARWRRWPIHITVPTAYHGSGKQVDVRLCFEEAMTLVNNCVGPGANPKCDQYFLDLGNDRRPDMRRSLTDLLAYKLFFFRNGADDVADDFKGSGKVAVTSETLWTDNVNRFATISIDSHSARSPVSLAATIVHELAHCAGAPGRPEDSKWAGMNEVQRTPYFSAENALKVCGMFQQYNPNIYGEIQDRFARAMNIRPA